MLSESEVNMVVGCVLRKRGSCQPISSPSQDGKRGGDSGPGDPYVEGVGDQKHDLPLDIWKPGITVSKKKRSESLSLTRASMYESQLLSVP
jgi:hypothetical protein